MTLSGPFDRPELAALLLAAPLLLLAELRVLRRRARRLVDLVGPRASALAPDALPTRGRTRALLFAGGLLLACVALMRPAWGEDVRTLARRGVDVALCLDVSRSMLAQDSAPTRLERAKSELVALAGRVAGDRLALVAFAGDARLLVPLTEDGASFAALVDEAEPLVVGAGGTDLGAALDAGLDALAAASGDARAIVLLTDGEDLAGRGREAAERCRARGVSVHCVAFGSELGSKIALDGGDGFLRDRAGREVVSSRDEGGLRALVQAGGGELVDGDRASAPLDRLWDARIRPEARQALDGQGLRERRQHYQWPLLVALLLWLVEAALPERRRTTHLRRRALDARVGAARAVASATRARALLLAGAAALLAPGCGRVTDAGRRAFAEGRFDDARDAFLAAADASGADAPCALLLDATLAALAAGDVRGAGDALARAEAAPDASAHGATLGFLRGNLALAQAELAASQASGPEAEPFAWDVAVLRAEAARDAWLAAAVSRDDWPEARRNVERAARRLAEYEQARAQAAGNRVLDEKKETRIVAVPPRADVGGAEQTREEEADVEARKDELSSGDVAALLGALDAKEREKRARRVERRAALGTAVERDW